MSKPGAVTTKNDVALDRQGHPGFRAWFERTLRQPSPRSVALRYGIACLVAVAATLLRLGLQPILKDSAPFSIALFGTLFVAWYLGCGPALATVALAAFLGDYFILSPQDSMFSGHFNARHNALSFSAVTIILALLTDAQRTARRRAEAEIAQRLKVEEMLRQQQAEIEALNTQLQRAMAESHHRIKNHLQMLAALVDMQTGESETVPRSALSRVNQHIRALAALHDLLTSKTKFGTGNEMIAIRDALGKMLPTLQTSAGQRQITVSIEEVSLPLKQAGTCMLLVNELLSNAIKHGKGNIELRFERHGDGLRLEVGDDGPGFPSDFDPQAMAHTGLELIESLSRWDLKGQTSYENRAEGGARVAIMIPQSMEAMATAANSETDLAPAD